MAQILHCCGSGRRPAATAPIGPLAWKPPYAAGEVLEKAKGQKNKTKQNKQKTALSWHKHFFKFHKYGRLFIYLFFCFLGPHLWHLKFPKLVVESELQLPAYTTATAMPDSSCIWNLHHSSVQCWILNPQRPGMEPATSWFLVGFVNHCTMTGTPIRYGLFTNSIDCNTSLWFVCLYIYLFIHSFGELCLSEIYELVLLVLFR